MCLLKLRKKCYTAYLAKFTLLSSAAQQGDLHSKRVLEEWSPPHMHFGVLCFRLALAGYLDWMPVSTQPTVHSKSNLTHEEHSAWAQGCARTNLSIWWGVATRVTPKMFSPFQQTNISLLQFVTRLADVAWKIFTDCLLLFRSFLYRKLDLLSNPENHLQQC